MKSDNISSVENKLYNIPLFGKKVGLKNIERLILEMDFILPLTDYLNKTKIIHVTGTNGKGSVCSMLRTIYDKEGYTVGMFTSPHIEHITERIQFNNNNVNEKLFIEGYECIRTIVDRIKEEGIIPTFFEWVFGIALYCFAVKQPEILIIEVGIGGRLDTTNVLPQKALSIITPIGLDHQNILGETIEEITNEKAGIIKHNGKVVLYNENSVVENIIDRITADIGAECYKVLPNRTKIYETSQLGIDFSIGNKYYCYEKLRLPVCGTYQIENASITLTAIEALKDILPVSDDSIQKGIHAFHWVGRFESVAENLIVDGAHNELGAITLVNTIKKMYGDSKVDLLFAIKEGKNSNEIIQVFENSGCFDRIYVVDLSILKSEPKEVLISKFKMGKDKVIPVDQLRPFLKMYCTSMKERLLIGAGSLYLVSEIIKIVQEEDLK